MARRRICDICDKKIGRTDRKTQMDILINKKKIEVIYECYGKGGIMDVCNECLIKAIKDNSYLVKV